ncbi:MAG: NAD(P)/FAD-dependent oxidoreductase [Chloroflexota bacterium]
MTHTTDVAIIGGGLAGLTAALRLRALGFDVTLYESGGYPRHRVCGEFMSPECSAVLNELGLGDAISRHQPATITVVRITAPAGTTWNSPLPAAAIGLSRYAVDALMAEAAVALGVDLRTNTVVRDVQGTLDTGFTLVGNEKTSARVVIGAFGKRSRLDKSLSRRFRGQPAPFTGLKMHYDGPPLDGRVELHTFPGGYCGINEIEDGVANLCLLTETARVREAGGIDGFVAWMRAQNPALDAWMADATLRLPRWEAISQVSFARREPVERDVLMTGDAAGLISPLAGDGMGMAFESGLLAADHAGAFLREETTAAELRADYAAAWTHEFRNRLRLGRALQAAMLRPTMLNVGLGTLQAAPPIGRWLIAATRA